MAGGSAVDLGVTIDMKPQDLAVRVDLQVVPRDLASACAPRPGGPSQQTTPQLMRRARQPPNPIALPLPARPAKCWTPRAAGPRQTQRWRALEKLLSRGEYDKAIQALIGVLEIPAPAKGVHDARTGPISCGPNKSEKKAKALRKKAIGPTRKPAPPLLRPRSPSWQQQRCSSSLRPSPTESLPPRPSFLPPSLRPLGR